MRKSATISAGLFGVLFLSFGCANDPSAKPAGPPTFPVKVVSVQAQLVPQSTDYLATLKSRNSAVSQPQVEGDIITRAGRSKLRGAATFGLFVPEQPVPKANIGGETAGGLAAHQALPSTA